MRDERDTRREYRFGALQQTELETSPHAQFARWLEAALDDDLPDATAMTLATADAEGIPSARIVLLKHFDEAGYCWYSDYRSHKAADMAANPRAALVFHWREHDRQVRITGAVERLDAAASDAYFASRPLESKLSAAASVQSHTVASREILEKRVAELLARYPDGAIPRPADWGGYRLVADTLEFWQGRAGRLHDRFRYSPSGAGGWLIERLQP